MGEKTEAQESCFNITSATQLLSGRPGFKEGSDSTAHLPSTLSLYPIMHAMWVVWAFGLYVIIGTTVLHWHFS